MPVSSPSTSVEWIARRERAAVVASLVITIALAWAWLVAAGGMDMGRGRPGGLTDMAGMQDKAGTQNMAGMQGMARSGNRGGPGIWTIAPMVVFAMWAVMMIAMMLPSAAPVILLYAALARSRAGTVVFPPVAIFAAGYVLVWTAFSAVATAAHLTLREAALLSPALRSTSGVLAAVLLVAAGVYQVTPVKAACLRNCRSPLQFLILHWRPGAAGALRLGVLHGGYCVGCCWAFMGLLFVGGAMNLWWVATMAAVILLEKTAFLGAPLGRIATGAGLVAAGAVALVAM